MAPDPASPYDPWRVAHNRPGRVSYADDPNDPYINYINRSEPLRKPEIQPGFPAAPSDGQDKPSTRRLATIREFFETNHDSDGRAMLDSSCWIQSHGQLLLLHTSNGRRLLSDHDDFAQLLLEVGPSKTGSNAADADSDRTAILNRAYGNGLFGIAKEIGQTIARVVVVVLLIGALIGALQVVLRFGQLVVNRYQAKEWMGHVYPHASNLLRSYALGEFESLEACREASISRLHALGAIGTGEYECGFRCRPLFPELGEESALVCERNER